MPTFAIQHGSVALCSWDIETREATFHPQAIRREGLFVLDETEKITFVLNPYFEGMEHRIFIGDVPLSDVIRDPEDSGGESVEGKLYWRQLPYFESARGLTRILLDVQSEDSQGENWTTIFTTEVYVHPSKLGDDRYQAMADDLQQLSRSLLIDLYGKSKQTHDVRFAHEGRAFHSREDELASIEKVLIQLGDVLGTIAQRPASCVRIVREQINYWGHERLTPEAVTLLARRGVSALTADRPFRILGSRKSESFDIAEHRVVRAFLDILFRRANYCIAVGRSHILAINSDRLFRHVRLSEGPTLYESNDLPRIKRLERLIENADRSVTLITTMINLPFLREVRPQLVAVREGAFQRSAEYALLLRIMRRFLIGNAVWYEGDEMSAVTKLTSRLFEQWCYLRVIEAFRECDLELREWDDVVRQNLRSHFILDFNRGLMFEGELGADLRIRFRYEPWILCEESARKCGESLCRGLSSEVAWCPDIVIECMKKVGEAWRPVYGIVMDCKYTAKLTSHHWTATAKYLEIRSAATRRQVMRQLWLIAPGQDTDIQSEDPAVQFDHTGPSCRPDESVRFRLITMHKGDTVRDSGGSREGDSFLRFAKGTINYLRREFGFSRPEIN